MSRPFALASIVAVSVAAAAIGVADSAMAQEGPFGPLRVASNRSKYAGPCPVEIIFTGNVNLMPHSRALTFNYSWTRSDGAKTPVTVVHPPPGQRMLVVRDRWRLGRAGQHIDASVTLHVNSGNTHLEMASPVVPVNCR